MAEIVEYLFPLPCLAARCFVIVMFCKSILLASNQTFLEVARQPPAPSMHPLARRIVFYRKYLDVQPRLQPTHWRLLDSPVARNASSVFLPSRLTKGLESSPVAKYHNASDPIVGIHLSNNRRVKREDISAALSKNITMILEDLLKDYDKTERPSFKQGKKFLPSAKVWTAKTGRHIRNIHYSRKCVTFWGKKDAAFSISELN